MKGLVYTAPHQIEVQSRLDPQPTPDDVIIGVTACGICASNVHVYQVKCEP